MSYYLSFIVFWRDGGVEGLSSSLSASLPLFFFLARLKTASLIFFCHSPYSPHLVGCNITIRAIVEFFFSLLSFTYSPSSLSFPPPLLCCLLPLSHFVLFASGLEKKKKRLTPLQIHCSVFSFLHGNQFANQCSVAKLFGSLCLNLRGGGIVADCGAR